MDNDKNMGLLADIHKKQLEEIVYRDRRAIEYAMMKSGKGWDNNRQRLSFYDYFYDYLHEQEALGYQNES